MKCEEHTPQEDEEEEEEEERRRRRRRLSCKQQHIRATHAIIEVAALSVTKKTLQNDGALERFCNLKPFLGDNFT